MTKYFYIEESPSKLGVIYVRVSDSTEIRYGRSREEVQKSGEGGGGGVFCTDLEIKYLRCCELGYGIGQEPHRLSSEIAICIRIYSIMIPDLGSVSQGTPVAFLDWFCPY